MQHHGLRIGDHNLSGLRHGGDDGVAVLALEIFSLRKGHLQAHSEIVGEVRAAYRDRAGMSDRALEEDDEIG